MNILLLYDSQYGNTEQIARAIVGRLKEAGEAQAVNIAKTSYVELKGLDMLILGSPTQKWRPTKAIQSFLENAPKSRLKGLPAASFDTRFRAPWIITGSAARIISDKLQRLGAAILLPPESFFVSGAKGPLREGEIRRAEAWADAIIEARKKLDSGGK